MRKPPQAVMVIAALVSAPFATAQPAVEFPFADQTASISDNGVFTVASGDTVRMTRGRIMVFGPGWTSASQRDAVDTTMERTEGVRKFTGNIPEAVSGEHLSYTQTVERTPDGLQFNYELQPLADMEVLEISLVIDLPIDVYSGKRLLLYPSKQMQFPPQLPDDYHFIAAPTKTLSFRADTADHATLTFPEVKYCNVQDTRQWDGSAYQAFVKIVHGRTQLQPGDSYTLSFVLRPDDEREYTMPELQLSSDEPLQLSSVALPEEPLARYDCAEIQVDLAASYETPFDPDEVKLDGVFTRPDGTKVTVPGFYYQDYEFLNDGPLKVPAGDSKWLIRFAPTQIGQYSLKVIAEDDSGRVQKDAGKLRITASDDHGYVRVSDRDPRYFAFDDGTPYFPIGENVCWYGRQRGVRDYDVWFPHLAENGGNYARLWMPVWAFGIEWGERGVYRMDRAWDLDYVLRLAEKHGIYIKLCIENFRHWEDGPNPYDASRSGPCKEEMDFFTEPEARRMFRNRLRYIVARWGYSTNIIGWELWNEINCVNGYWDNPEPVIQWTADMCDYLNDIDPWDHLTTNSLGSCVVDDRYWELPQVDWAQVHGYYYFSDEMKRDAVDMAGFILKWLDKIDDHDRPAMHAEFGLTRGKEAVRKLCDKDTGGVHLHNGIWASALSGGCGSAMLWWWDSYVEPMNLYRQFRALAEFTTGVPWTTAGFEPVRAESSHDRLRIVGLQGDELILLWLQNRAHTWWNVVHEKPIETIADARVTIEGVAEGEYAIQWWDTKTGEVAARSMVVARNGQLILTVDELSEDLAVKVRRR